MNHLFILTLLCMTTVGLAQNVPATGGKASNITLVIHGGAGTITRKNLTPEKERAYRAVLNEEKLGLDTVRAVIEVKITPERGGGFDRLAERISKYSEVQSCYLMSGGYDLLVIVEGRNLREVASFVSEKLATIQGVISTATHFLLRAYKEQGILMKREQDEERLAITP